MIVDLLRNDLARVCEVGTVEVPALYSIETYETLHQMTSTVAGRLRPDASLTRLFEALFPCGSVTGAPKRSAMRLIERLEAEPRGVYCGAIGYAAPDGRAAFNVAIRTLVLRGGTGRMGVGSGIVWDSDWGAEYEECLLKGAFLSDVRRET
jgi:para-aminobenzoate synthetase/4-amino-4-deoxychorismate lyase